jgi:hypothetical protein
MITASTRFGDYVDAAFAAKACQPAMDVAVTIDPELTCEQGVQAMIAHVDFEDTWASWTLTYGPDIDDTLRNLWIDSIGSQTTIDETLRSPKFDQADAPKLEQKQNLGQLISELVSKKSDNPVGLFHYMERLADVLPAQALEPLRTVIEDKAPHLFEPEPAFDEIDFPGALWDYDENGRWRVINPEDNNF